MREKILEILRVKKKGTAKVFYDDVSHKKKNHRSLLIRILSFLFI
jgi:hypothetical protein